jgi:hypothetical protein
LITEELPTHLTAYALKTDLPDLTGYVKAVDLPEPTPAPALEFKTEFIETSTVERWTDLSTGWILLNVCHIEVNMISNGEMTIHQSTCGRLKIGMPLPSETVNAQLASLYGILALRLEPNGFILLSNIPDNHIDEGRQISLSIFYTFENYQQDSPAWR